MQDHFVEPVYFVNDGETQWLYVVSVVDSVYRLTRVKLHNFGEAFEKGVSWGCQLKIFKSTLVAEITPEITFYDGALITRNPWRPVVNVVDPDKVHKITDWITLVNG